MQCKFFKKIVESDEFKNGVQSLAKLLKVHPHSDHLMTLKACSQFIAQKLNTQALQQIGKIAKKNDDQVSILSQNSLFLNQFSKKKIKIFSKSASNFSLN